MGENLAGGSAAVNKNKATRFRLPRVGMRIVKTVISCLITSLLYEFVLGGRNPCFACIGAVYGLGNEFHEGFRNGFNRFVGTLIGGLVVIPFYWLYMNTPFGIPKSFYLAAGVFFAIYFNYALGAKYAIQPATVIFFVVLFTQPEGNYVRYTIARIIDTGIGVFISLVISVITPHPSDRNRGMNYREFHIHLLDGFKAWSLFNRHGSLPKQGENEKEEQPEEGKK